MAIIYSYPGSTPVKGTDRILASDTTQTGNPTINITVDGIYQYIAGLFGIGSGTPGTMPVWVTSTQLGNSYVVQDAAPVPTTKATENIEFLKTMTAIGDADLLRRVNIGTIGTLNASPFQIYNETQFYGDVRDTSGAIGTNTQVLSSLGAGAGVEWVDQLPSGLTYKGTWNADLNIPALASGVGTQGDYYIVSHDGTTNLDGFNSWEIGDWCVFNGTVWQEIDNQNIFSGSGTANTMTKWTGATSLGDSTLTDDGVTLASSTNILFTGTTNDLGVAAGTNQFYGLNYFYQNIRVDGEVRDASGVSGTAGQVLSSTGAGQVAWIDASSAAGVIGGSGTLNTIPKWTPSGTELGNSRITDDGTAITLDSNVVLGNGPTDTIKCIGEINIKEDLVDSVGSSGLSGYVLKSTGSQVEWVSPLAGTDGSRALTVTVDFNELANLATTPKVIIPAQGAGTVIEVLGVAFKYDYATVVYDFTSFLVVCPDGFVGNTDTYQAVFKQAFINGAGDIYQGNELGGLTYAGKLMQPNTAMVFTTPGIDPTQGDGDMRLNIRYRVLDVSTWTVITT
jgi:hypothetical protein